MVYVICRAWWKMNTGPPCSDAMQNFKMMKAERKYQTRDTSEFRASCDHIGHIPVKPGLTAGPCGLYRPALLSPFRHAFGFPSASLSPLNTSLFTELFPPARDLLSPTVEVLSAAHRLSSFLVLSLLLGFEHELYFYELVVGHIKSLKYSGAIT